MFGIIYLFNFIILFSYFVGIKVTKLNNLTIIDNINSIATQVGTSQHVNNNHGIELKKVTQSASANAASANPDSSNPALANVVSDNAVSGGFKKRNRKYNKNSFKVLKDQFLSLF